MTEPPRLAFGLLDWVGADEPVTGDLLEECRHRGRAWCWLQVLSLVSLTFRRRLRDEPLDTLQAIALTGALLILLGFSAVVAAFLLYRSLLPIGGGLWTLVSAGSTASAAGAVLCVLASVACGHAIGVWHVDRRTLAVVGCGLSVTAAAFIEMHLVSPSSELPLFMPSPVAQLTSAILFVIGLFLGAHAVAYQDSGGGHDVDARGAGGPTHRGSAGGRGADDRGADGSDTERCALGLR